MGKNVKSAIRLRDVQLFLDECKKTHELVTLTTLKKDGTKVVYEGWQVISSWWERGTHDVKNPKAGTIRKVIDVLIFEVNGHPVYI